MEGSSENRKNPAKSGNKNSGNRSRNTRGPGPSSRGRKSGGGGIPPTGMTPPTDPDTPPMGPGGRRDEFRVGDPTEFLSLTTTGNIGQVVDCKKDQNRPPKKPTSMTKKSKHTYAMLMDDFPPLHDMPMPMEGEGPPNRVQFQSPDASLPIGPVSSEPKKTNQTEDSPLGIRTYPDGRVTNIPGSMLNDQFGIAGFLAGLRIAKVDPHLILLSIGSDVPRQELKLKEPGTGTWSFAGPLQGAGPVGAVDIACPVPPEYLVNAPDLRGRLTPLKMNLYKDELVFYIFYNFTRDVLQIHAAEELFNRHWRYHMGEELWINAQGVSRLERGSHSVKGMYLFFDPVKFLKEKKEFHLDCNLFEGRPFVPRHFV